MEWKTHISLGILFGVITYVLLHRSIPAEINAIDFLVWTTFFSIASDFDVIFHHRSAYTHSLIAVVGAFAIGFILKQNLLWTFIAAAAVFSHLVGDSLTRSGVPLFYPFSNKRHVHFPYIGPRLRYDNRYANRTIQLVGAVLIVLVLVYGVYRGDLEESIIERVREYLDR
jgi:membrane-bound metal-dependent hydrolase YbcI (DUF457 family)